MNTGFTLDSIQTISNRVRRREISIVEEVSTQLERIEALNAELNIFTYIAREQALEQARQQDALIDEKKDPGPLAGITVAVKEIIAVDDMPTSTNSRMDVSDLLPQQGPFIEKLKQFGAIILGKTASTEFALSYQNLLPPYPLNPLYPDQPHSIGGSSSGSSAAVANQLCNFSIGTDTGGSIRIPAAFSKLAAFKPGPDYWSRDGFFPLSRELDTIGVIAGNMADLATIMAILGSRFLTKPDYTTLKLVIPKDLFFANLVPDVSHAMLDVINRLNSAKIKLSEIAFPDLDPIVNFATVVNSAALVRYLGRERVTRDFDLADPVTQLRFRAGLEATPIDIHTLVETRRALARKVTTNLSGYDALLMPTAPDLPPPLSQLQDAETILAWQKHTGCHVRIANLLDLAAVTIPLATPEPIGLQIMVPAGNEMRLIEIALAIQEALDITR